MRLKFLFNISKSRSVFTSGTFALKLPCPIDVEARIKLFIDLKNLDENLIAIDIETNKNKCARLDLNKLTLISGKNMLKTDFLNLEQDEYLENCSRQEKLIN